MMHVDVMLHGLDFIQFNFLLKKKNEGLKKNALLTGYEILLNLTSVSCVYLFLFYHEFICYPSYGVLVE